MLFVGSLKAKLHFLQKRSHLGTVKPIIYGHCFGHGMATFLIRPLYEVNLFFNSIHLTFILPLFCKATYCLQPIFVGKFGGHSNLYCTFLLHSTCKTLPFFQSKSKCSKLPFERTSNFFLSKMPVNLECRFKESK